MKKALPFYSIFTIILYNDYDTPGNHHIPVIYTKFKKLLSNLSVVEEGGLVVLECKDAME